MKQVCDVQCSSKCFIMWHWLITSEHTFFPPTNVIFCGNNYYRPWILNPVTWNSSFFPHINTPSLIRREKGFPTIAFFLRMVFRFSFLTSVNKLGLYKVTRPRSCHSHPLPVCKSPVLICWTDFWDYKQIAFRKKNMPSLWQPEGLRGSPPWNHQTMVSLRSL